MLDFISESLKKYREEHDFHNFSSTCGPLAPLAFIHLLFSAPKPTLGVNLKMEILIKLFTTPDVSRHSVDWLKIAQKSMFFPLLFIYKTLPLFFNLRCKIALQCNTGIQNGYLRFFKIGVSNLKISRQSSLEMTLTCDLQFFVQQLSFRRHQGDSKL